jgi:DNA-directed RNA polymerase specialized sigma24 family protein
MCDFIARVAGVVSDLLRNGLESNPQLYDGDESYWLRSRRWPHWEDAVQEALSRIIEAGVPPESNSQKELEREMRKYFSAQRRRARRAVSFEDELVPAQGSLSDQIAARDLLNRVPAVVTASELTLLVGHCQDGLSVEELARRDRQSADALRKRLSRARAQLRRTLDSPRRGTHLRRSEHCRTRRRGPQPSHHIAPLNRARS